MVAGSLCKQKLDWSNEQRRHCALTLTARPIPCFAIVFRKDRRPICKQYGLEHTLQMTATNGNGSYDGHLEYWEIIYSLYDKRK